MPVRVGIVEDHQGTRDYLAALFNGTDGLQLAGAHGTGGAALDALERDRPGVLVVDLNLPDMPGIEVIRTVKEQSPGVEIVVLTMHGDREHLFEALRAGADGYLTKGSSAEEILRAVRMAADGGAPISGRIARQLIREFQEPKTSRDPGQLTAREQEVLRGIAEGLSERRLAARLSLSPHTVHCHVKSIYRKLHARTRVEAVAKAREREIV